MLSGSCILGTICTYENGTPKVARNAFIIGEIWNPVYCNGNKTVKPVLWSIFRRIFYERFTKQIINIGEQAMTFSVPQSSPYGRHVGLMISALDSGANGPSSSPARGHCAVFLGKTLYSYSASLHPGV